MRADQLGDLIVGRQLIGAPGSIIVKVEPTADYLINGPVGDGWYDAAEKRYVTTDFRVTVRFDGGREGILPKSYQWVTTGTGVCGPVRTPEERENT